MNMRPWLATAAWSIAILAAVDPELTRSRTRLEPLTVVALDDAAASTAAGLADRVGGNEVSVQIHSHATAAAACPQHGACVIVSSGSLPARPSAGARVLAVVAHDLPDVRIDAPASVHRDAAAALTVTAAGPLGRVEVFDGEILLGSAEAGEATTISVPWIPVATGARALRIRAAGETHAASVVVSDAAVPVLMFEPQVTWQGTYIRRALEDDGRFALAGRARVAPQVAVMRGEPRGLDTRTLETVRTAVVTAPDQLTTAEVDVLERFVRDAGGSLVIAADRKPAGPVLRLLPPVKDERRTPQPQSIGLLRASEWVTFSATTGTVSVAAVDSRPVIASRAVGRGRVIVSGALDAWRFREQGQGFAAFWTSLIWNAAAAAGPRLRVEPERPVAALGEAVRVDVERQAIDTDSLPAAVQASGSLDCEGTRSPLRLWPGPRPGSFWATVRAARTGRCVVAVTVGGEAGATTLTIVEQLAPPGGRGPQLQALAAATGAMYGDDANDAGVVEAIGRSRRGVTESQPWWPMRSAYWILPFALCLSGEWWLRRRAGLS